MNRSRNWTPLHSTWRDDPRIQDVGSHAARTFFFLLLPQLDEWGRAPGEVRRLHAIVWPCIASSVEETQHALAACVAARLIELYEVGGKTYLHVPDWEAHAGNVGKRSHRRKSEFPEPPAQGTLQLVPPIAPACEEHDEPLEVHALCNDGATRVRDTLAGLGQLGRKGHSSRTRSRVVRSSLSDSSLRRLRVNSVLPAASRQTAEAARAPFGASQGPSDRAAKAAHSNLRRELIDSWNREWVASKHPTAFPWSDVQRNALVGMVSVLQQTEHVGAEEAVRILRSEIAIALRDTDHWVKPRMSPTFFRSQWARWRGHGLRPKASSHLTDAGSSLPAEQKLRGRAAL